MTLEHSIAERPAKVLLSLLLIVLLALPLAAFASFGKEANSPANLLELMESLHGGLHNGQFFDETFYTEERVKQLTGAQQVWIVRHQGKPVRYAAAGVGFRNAGDPRSGMSFRIFLEISPDGDKRVIVDGQIPREQPLLREQAIGNLIGHAWKNERHATNSDDRHHEYRFRNGGALEKGHFRFTPTGSLGNFVMTRKESYGPDGRLADSDNGYGYSGFSTGKLLSFFP